MSLVLYEAGRTAVALSIIGINRSPIEELKAFFPYLANISSILHYHPVTEPWSVNQVS